ncbi:MAG: hypothetical protein QM770_21480 [Tepidisphaeraceae bacterium]
MKQNTLFRMSSLEPRRHLAGDLDGSFGTLGRQGVDLGSGFDPTEIVTASDGKLLVAGVSNGVGFVARLLASGTLDKSFGVNGILSRSVAGALTESIVPLAGGASLIAFGKQVWKLTSAGKLDTTFSSDGVYDAPYRIDAIRSLASGRIVLGMTSGNTAAYRQELTTAGTLVGSTVALTRAKLPDEDIVYQPILVPAVWNDLAIDSLGRIVSVVDSGDHFVGPQGYPAAVARWAVNGALDTSFSGDGLTPVISGLNGRLDYAHSVGLIAIARDDSVRWIEYGDDNDIYLHRTASNGSSDSFVFFETGVIGASGQTGYVKDLLFAADGSMYAVATNVIDMPFHQQASAAIVVKYRADGSLDPAFNRALLPDTSPNNPRAEGAFAGNGEDVRGGTLDAFGTPIVLQRSAYANGIGSLRTELLRFAGAQFGTAGDRIAIRNRSLEIEATSGVDSIVATRYIGFDGKAWLGLDFMAPNSAYWQFTTPLSSFDRVKVWGLDGADTIDFSALSVSTTLLGGAGNDRLVGGSQGDSLDGGDGNDTIAGMAGPDTIDGGAGNDNLRGWSGTDLLRGGAGDDTILGDDQNDTLIGGTGKDFLDGGGGVNSADNDPLDKRIAIAVLI